MTKPIISIFTQSLDNQQPDLIINDDHVLSYEDDDREARTIVISEISKITSAGRPVFNDNGVTLFQEGYEFVLEVATLQSDISGRVSTIVFRGNIPLNNGEYEKWREELAKSIIKIIDELNRSVSDTVLRTIQDLALKLPLSKLQEKIHNSFKALFSDTFKQLSSSTKLSKEKSPGKLRGLRTTGLPISKMISHCRHPVSKENVPTSLNTQVSRHKPAPIDSESEMLESKDSEPTPVTPNASTSTLIEVQKDDKMKK